MIDTSLHSNGSIASGRRRRRTKPGDLTDCKIKANGHAVHFTRRSDDEGSQQQSLSVETREFPNSEFVSESLQTRKLIWYSGLELRAIKQANLDLCNRLRQQQEKRNSSRKQSKTLISDDDDDEDDSETTSICSRGLEHLMEGETERRLRIRSFVVGLLHLQEEKKRKGIRPETTADALQTYSRSHSRPDRQQAAKIGRWDQIEIQHEQSPPETLLRRGSSLGTALSSSRTSLLSKMGSKRFSRRGTSDKGIRRHSSADGIEFSGKKPPSFMRRVSHKAFNKAMHYLGSSTRSLQSSVSNASSTNLPINSINNSNHVISRQESHNDDLSDDERKNDAAVASQ